MELLDRYLQGIKFWLPRAQQEDIAAELSEDIQSQIADEETRLGRPLNEAETAAILQQRGRPLLVAQRYLPQQSLIGPVLFPVYRFVLKIVILAYLAPRILVWLGFMIFDSGYRNSHTIASDLVTGWGSFWINSLTVFTIVTVVFAVLEQAQARSHFLEDWDPRKLPPVRDPYQIPRVNSTVEIAASIFLLVLWVKGVWSQTVFNFGEVQVELAPVWHTFCWALLLLSLANIAVSAANLARPYWSPLRSGLRLATDCIGSIIFCWFLKAHILASISVPHLSPARAAEICDAINLNISKSLPFAVLACIIIVALSDGGRFLRLRTSHMRLARKTA